MSEGESKPEARVVEHSFAGAPGGPRSEHIEWDDGTAMDVFYDPRGPGPAAASWMDEVEPEPDVHGTNSQ